MHPPRRKGDSRNWNLTHFHPRPLAFAVRSFTTAQRALSLILCCHDRQRREQTCNFIGNSPRMATGRLTRAPSLTPFIQIRSTDQSTSFLSLPPEIRTDIYDLCLNQPTSGAFTVPQYSSLVRTCRIMHYEFQPYLENLFQVFPTIKRL